jgi:HNH endonuclease
MTPQCTVPGCVKPVRSAKAELCAMHYHRKYRHGSVDRVSRDAGITTVRGRYKMKYVPGHPLAGANGKAYVHRLVLHTVLGPGAHACHWCSTAVLWETVEGDPAQLHVDHLNGQRDDNRPENLVPSCKSCNVARAGQARHRALVAVGFWSEHDTIQHLSSGGRRPELVVA